MEVISVGLRLPHGVRVGKSNIGRGLFADRNFRAGERILIFTGSRFNRADPIHDGEDGAYLLQTGPRSYILPDFPAVFINHSCNPNAGVATGRRLVALRDIAAQEEIRFDYSTTMDEDLWTMICCCGEQDCRSVIRDFKYLPDDTRLRYIALGVVPRFIRRRYQRPANFVEIPPDSV